MSKKLPFLEKLPWGKGVKKAILVALCVAAGCGAVWGGLTIARNAQRGSVNVYAVSDFAMTSYWGDSSTTSGTVATDKIQKITISSSQTVKKVWVKEGDEVKKGATLVSYDSTLTQAEIERARVDYDRQVENLETAKSELELLKKAQSRETLEAELESLQKQLDAAKAKYDKAAGYDPDKAVTNGKIEVKDATGNDKDHPLYYAVTSDAVLNDAGLTAILDALGRAHPNAEKKTVDTYLVLVYRDGDKLGGSPTSLGLCITETYKDDAEPTTPTTPTTPTEGEESGSGGSGSSGEDSGSGAAGTDEKTDTDGKISISFKFCNDLPAYEDEGRTYTDDKEIAALEKKVAYAQELVDAAMDRDEINKAILEKTQTIKETEVSNKLAKLSLEKKIKELGDGNVYAEFDGTVKAVRDPDEAYNNSEPVVELSGGGGYYITGALSEMDLGSVQVGNTVQVSSWMTGVSCEGTIVSIDDYPTANGSSWSDGNTNVSYYPFKVFVTEDANLQAGDYVELQYQKAATADESTGLYIDSMFVREDNGKSYVMVRGEDGKLEKRWVQTGRNLWGSYTQIRGGLSAEDYIAFPYGRDVTEGASTVEATAEQLYNSGV